MLLKGVLNKAAFIWLISDYIVANIVFIFAIQGISNPDINTSVQVLNTVCVCVCVYEIAR